MPYKDKEKHKEYLKTYYEANKDKIKEYKKNYREKNKEKLKEIYKEYREANKEKLKEQRKEYRQTPIGKKSHTINSWKRIGVIHNNFDLLYETYINKNNCDVCNNQFKSSRDRHLDHCHETGLFRQILCCSCNVNDYWKKIVVL